MESIMNRTRRSIRSMVSSVDDDDNDDDGSTPFYAAAIIKAAIPRISSRSTRNTKPRCLHLAPSKVEFEKKYPKYLFCSNCENLYQKLVVEQGRKVSPDSRRYMCEATHENFIHPTQLKPIHFLLVNIVDDVDDDVTSLGSELEYSDDADDNNNKQTNNNTKYEEKIKSTYTICKNQNKESERNGTRKTDSV
jgi:hypothetical protein